MKRMLEPSRLGTTADDIDWCMIIVQH